MKKGNVLIVFVLLVLVCAGFTACKNNIIGKWWEEEQSPELEYVPVIKFVPQFIYEIMIEKVPETIFVSLPPETIIEYVYVELPPQLIYEIIIETIEIEKEVFVQEIVEVIKEVIVEKEIYLQPTPEQIIEYIKENPEIIIEIIREDNTIYETIKEIILEHLTEEEIKEIIKNIPPEVICEYLTEEQIKYIISQQPPEIILQNISIIVIEYIIFAGESSEFNGPPGLRGTTALTPQEMNSNMGNVIVIAQALVNNPNFMLILHGNANPVTGTEEEKVELIEISNKRAVSVAKVLDEEYRKLPAGAAGVYPSNRVTTSGYGGERNLVEGSTSYAGLNRRVEMILFRVETIKP